MQSSRNSRMSSLLGKIYSGLLHKVRLWVAITEIGTDGIMSGWPIYKLKAMGCKVATSTLAYNCS